MIWKLWNQKVTKFFQGHNEPDAQMNKTQLCPHASRCSQRNIILKKIRDFPGCPVLRLHAHNAQSLVRELRSCKPHGTAKKQQK